uniref:Uncharacterized protein n=1 Tax=Meloidogyne enterolobii TaxID=390850 RepID=A0A6V7W3R3_MELEN|nr:unnamed protein product [Meloidogyne enterolobii]
MGEMARTTTTTTKTITKLAFYPYFICALHFFPPLGKDGKEAMDDGRWSTFLHKLRGKSENNIT